MRVPDVALLAVVRTGIGRRRDQRERPLEELVDQAAASTNSAAAYHAKRGGTSNRRVRLSHAGRIANTPNAKCTLRFCDHASYGTYE